MIRFNFTCFLIILFSSGSSAQDWLKDTCALKGNVKSLRYESKIQIGTYERKEDYTYEYNSSGFLVRYNLSNSDMGKGYNAYYRIYDETGTHCLIEYYIQSGDTASRYDFTYNEQGFPDRAILYNWGRHWSTFHYVYNEKRLVAECFVVIQHDKDTIRQFFEYDEAGRMVKDSDLSETSKEIKSWKYDLNGYLIEEKLLDTSWASSTVIKMDKDGNKLSEERTDYSENPYTADSYIIHFEYNERGQITKETETDIAQKLISESIYSYNEEGEVAKMTYYNAERDKLSEKTYTYIYDSHGNWIVKNTIRSSGELFQEEKRTIQYF